MKRAIMVGLARKSYHETLALAEDLDYEIVKEFTQKLSHPRRATYLGKGKLEEVGIATKEEGCDAVIVGDDLTPRQVFEMESVCNCPVKDRIQMILEAFERSAQGQTAKLEVKLARLEHEIPFLREYAKLITQSERAGFYAGGIQRVDVYLNQIRRERRRIERDLTALEGVKKVRQNRRKKGGFFQISLAGFTNSGKTSLYNLLTSSQEEISNRFFTTLETRTGKCPGRGPILYSDTVGFYSDLPPWVFKAFRATLDEIYGADGVILMVNGDQPYEDILTEAEMSISILSKAMEPGSVLPFVSKVDTMTKTELKDTVKALSQPIHGWVMEWRGISVLDSESTVDIINRAVMERWFPDTITFTLNGKRLRILDEMERYGIAVFIKKNKAGVTASFRFPIRNVAIAKEILSKREPKPAKDRAPDDTSPTLQWK